jgi:hypothetical protein
MLKIIEWDEEGYPTEESLQKLSEVLNSLDFMKAKEAFYDALKENIYRDACGRTQVEVRGKTMDVWEYHTYGWSGNEAIIRTLYESSVWGLFFQRHDAGGHYYFTLPEHTLSITTTGGSSEQRSDFGN